MSRTRHVIVKSTDEIALRPGSIWDWLGKFFHRLVSSKFTNEELRFLAENNELYDRIEAMLLQRVTPRILVHRFTLPDQTPEPLAISPLPAISDLRRQRVIGLISTGLAGAVVVQCKQGEEEAVTTRALLGALPGRGYVPLGSQEVQLLVENCPKIVSGDLPEDPRIFAHPRVFGTAGPYRLCAGGARWEGGSRSAESIPFICSSPSGGVPQYYWGALSLDATVGPYDLFLCREIR